MTFDLIGLLALLWITASAASFLWLIRNQPTRFPSLIGTLLIAFIIRIVPAFFFPRGAGYEMRLFEQIGRLTTEGGNVYLSELAWPYLPVMQFWAAASVQIADRIGPFFIFWLKLPGILSDTLIVLLIYVLIQRLRGTEAARFGALLYAVNPLTTLVAAYQGQFDTITLLFLMLSWFFFEKRDSASGPVWSALLLGCGILVKTWPFVFIAVVMWRLPTWKQRATYVALAAAVPLAVVACFELAYPGSLFVVIRRATRAGAISGWWGYSSILDVGVKTTGMGQVIYGPIARYGQRLALLCALGSTVLTRRQSTLRALIIVILVLFTVMPNLGLQGLSWLVPLGVVYGVGMLPLKGTGGVADDFGRIFTLYILGSFVHMAIAYGGLHMGRGLDFLPSQAIHPVIQLSSLTAWVPIVIWLFAFSRPPHQSKSVASA